MAIVDASAWRVVANYKEYYLRHLPPGRQVWVWLDSNPRHLDDRDQRADDHTPAAVPPEVRGHETANLHSLRWLTLAARGMVAR